MDVYSSSSSSVSSRPWIHDVFLSFRAEDTRKNFTDYLYYALKDAGISTFLDDYKVGRGDYEAIQKSRISLIVFSKNYAVSTQCLEELVKMMECRKTAQQIVLPIFYDVDPSHVRKQTGSYAQVFSEHQKNFASEMEKVASWRAALTEAANLSGWDLRNIADGHQGKFIRNIVEEIMRELNQTYLFVAMYPVGLDSRVQDLTDLLNVGSDDILMVGICGMGGIGKTTIAKAVHNQLFHSFDGKSFLANVRENSTQPPNGQVRLQEQLLSDILKSGKIKLSSVDRGINVIKERLQNRRVLVILDDVDHSDQLNALAGNRDWFGPGSRIIITTRDEQLLKQLHVDQTYMVQELSEVESLELFSWHAFRKAYPSEDYVALSEDVVAYSERLPLALAVLGSFLFKRSIAEWKSALEKLKRIPYNEIQKKLRISFDALINQQEKDMFLDIACFFVHMDKDYAIKIMEGSERGISLLTRRCLVSINEKNKLIMHDLLRDMGREIVREESPKFPEKCSRLWREEDVLSVLRNQRGTEAVEGILLSLPRASEIRLNSKAFAMMSKLRLLKLNHACVTGEYGEISKELRWLCWHKFPLNCIPTDFFLENLVALDMRHSKLRQIWKDNKFLGKLKVLNLGHSPYLIKTPDFIQLPVLEKLILKDCGSLVEIHHSIGHLQRLLVINLRGCENLRSIPWTICKLKSLEILNLFGCTKIENLPEDIGEMESLIELTADGTMISQVPFTIVRLKNLRKLSLCGCNGPPSKSLPSLFRYFSSTRRARCTNLLPPSLAGLNSLTTLGLSNCRLSDDGIPKDIGLLSSLTDLDLRGNIFHSLPNSIGNLPKLKLLQVDDCSSLQYLPELPKALSTLYANDCRSLKRISNISNLKHSPNLFLTNCSSLVDVSCLENLCGVIHMEGCNSLEGTFVESLLKRLSLTEHGTFYLPGSNIPSWFDHQSSGSSVSFMFPLISENCKWKGFTLCFVFEIVDRKEPEAYPCITFANKSRGIERPYRPNSYQVPHNVSQDQICLYHLPYLAFGDMLYGGEQVEVAVDLGDGLIVKRCGIYFVFEQDEMRNVQQSLAYLDGNANLGNEENAKRRHAHVDDGDGISPKRLKLDYVEDEED